ncbi:hypothetical protein ACQYFS_001907 [Acinetobacter baumannii]|nr:hypothetical protein [Acinetobacter baumannii]MCJ1919737.1 hypothetical protein [Acinetobacter baumannii]MCJ2243114.1 hypothetical protein [Acinetobacter baumannii]MCJ2247028.1 hypothetical protein [Acinetobacter baumannii]MCJ2274849.1 hypothetical protein [Acinetobacter baumannii]
MTDLNKEEQACLGAFESMWDGFCEAYGNGHDQALAKMFFIGAWSQAKAQAVLEKKIYLTCEQLYAAANFGAPNKDPELLETELTIAWFDEAHSDSGYYVYISEYPEEGAMKLESESGAEG